MEASAGAPPAQSPPAEAPPQGEGAAEGAPLDVAEQFKALNAKIDALGPEQPQPAPGAAGIYDGLAGPPPEPQDGIPEYDPSLDEQFTGYDVEPGFDPGFDPAQYAQEFQPQPALDAETAQRLSAVEQQQAADRIERNLIALEDVAQRVPQLADPKFQSQVRDQLEPLAARLGNEGVFTDPTLVAWAATNLVAAEDAETATPAEEAVVGPGAVETGAGPGNQEADTSYSDEKGDAIVASGTKPSAFS